VSDADADDHFARLVRHKDQAPRLVDFMRELKNYWPYRDRVLDGNRPGHRNDGPIACLHHEVEFHHVHSSAVFMVCARQINQRRTFDVHASLAVGFVYLIRYPPRSEWN